MPDTHKYWFNGEPFPGVDVNNGTIKFWLNGEPFGSIASPDYFLTFSDTLSLADSLIVVASNTIINMTFSDALSLSDSSTVRLLTPLELVATDQIDIFDGIILQFLGLYNVIQEDALNLTDSIATLVLIPGINRSVSDQIIFNDTIAYIVRLLTDSSESNDILSFSDAARLEISGAISQGDMLSLTDSIQIRSELNLNILEALNLSDNIQIQLTANLTVLASDSIALTDAVSYFQSTTFINYIRRYLNDVPR